MRHKMKTMCGLDTISKTCVVFIFIKYQNSCTWQIYCISFLIGSLAHELLMSLRNNILWNFTACTYMHTCMHIQTDKFPLEYHMVYIGKRTHHLKKRPIDDGSMPHNSWGIQIKNERRPYFFVPTPWKNSKLLSHSLHFHCFLEKIGKEQGSASPFFFEIMRKKIASLTWNW